MQNEKCKMENELARFQAALHFICHLALCILHFAFSTRRSSLAQGGPA
jgi:hypothetical protein